jgi:hypothetical protein
MRRFDRVSHWPQAPQPEQGVQLVPVQVLVPEQVQPERVLGLLGCAGSGVDMAQHIVTGDAATRPGAT